MAMKNILAESIKPEQIEQVASPLTVMDVLDAILEGSNIDVSAAFAPDDPSDDDDFLEHLYVEPSNYLYGRDRVTRDAERKFKNIGPIRSIDTKKLWARLADGSPKATFIFGDVGSGKTTFVKHFMKFYGKKQKKGLAFRMSFQGYDDMEDDNDFKAVYNSLVDELEQDLWKYLVDSDLRPDYAQFVLNGKSDRRFRKFRRQQDQGRLDTEDLDQKIEMWGQRSPEVAARSELEFLRSRGYRILLILDDVDPLSYKYQKKLAKKSLKFVEREKVQLIVTLRFFSLSVIGKLVNLDAAFGPYAKLYNLDIPSIPDLVTKRLDHMVFSRIPKNSFRIPLRPDRRTGEIVTKDTVIGVTRFLCERMLLGEVQPVFIALSSLNIRVILRNVQSIMESMHIGNVPEILRTYHRRPTLVKLLTPGRAYDIMVRSVTTNGDMLYNRGSSSVENVYRTYGVSKRWKSAFLIKVYLLRIIYEQSSTTGRGRTRQFDFVSKSEVHGWASELGFSLKIVEKALENLFEKGLLFGYEADNYKDTKRMTLSNCGVQYEQRIRRSVYYLYFMAFEFLMSEDRIQGHFLGEADDEGMMWHSVNRDRYENLYDDNLIHAFVAMFIHELADLEEWHLANVLRQDPKSRAEAYLKYMSKPITAELASSFERHVKKSGKTNFDQITHDLKKRSDELVRYCRDRIRVAVKPQSTENRA